LKLSSSSNDMTTYSPKEYWTGLAENHSGDAAGFSPVLHPNAPAWFNRLIDELQFRALRRALALAKVPDGSRALDVGCGTGRWVRRYEEIGLRATGVDATAGMLRLARRSGTAAPLAAGEAFRLPFADATFDFVSDVTVVQHILPSLQPQALGEMIRVLKPGGRLVLMELIRGKDAHIFPRKPQDWIRQVTSRGAKPIGWFGQEFLLPDRLFVLLAQTVAGENGSREGGAPSAETPPPKVSAARRLYWTLRHITAPLSAWTDPIAEKVCPAQLATHGVFIFQK
jgi:SAM-dependent methyltransferase